MKYKVRTRETKQVAKGHYEVLLVNHQFLFVCPLILLF